MSSIFKSLKESYNSRLDENQSLVTVLKNSNYKLAAEMILDPVNASRYLNEADRGVLPLSIVLCGDLPGELINLYLAKLMVERGVDVNWRIRNRDYMSMSSCFEQLIDLFLDINGSLKTDCFKIPHLIGVNNQPVKSLAEARRHLVEILKLFLEFGGNPNFRSRTEGCTLFHKILKSRFPDLEVIHILRRSGGDINKLPRIGFPPVVSLINNSFCDNVLPIVKQIWIPSAEEICFKSGPGSARTTTVANSALMVAMHTASTASALFFLEQGAQFDNVRIYNTNNGQLDTISCLFLPLFYQSLPYFKYFAAVTLNTNDNYLKDYVLREDIYLCGKKCTKLLMCKVVSSSIFPVADAIAEFPLISEEEINHIISKYTLFDGKMFFQQCSLSSIFSALFGQSTTTLQQLCVRSIFDNTFFNKPTLDIQKLIHGLKYPAYSDKPCLAEYVIRNVKSMVNDINDVVIKNLINCLCLPAKLKILFQLEAARLQVYLNLNEFECLDEFYDVPSQSESQNSKFVTSNFQDSELEEDEDVDDDDDDDDSDDNKDEDNSEWDSSSDDFSQNTSTPSSHQFSSAVDEKVNKQKRNRHCDHVKKHDSGDSINDENNDDCNDCSCFLYDDDGEDFSQSYDELSETSSSFDSSSLSLG